MNGDIGATYWDLGFTWTPQILKIMALKAVIMGFGLLFHIHIGV